MMRKLVKHGPSSIIVSLPKKWIDSNGLKPKDEVMIKEKGNSLLIEHQSNIKKNEEISIDITDYDRTTLLLLMHAIYRASFSKATFHFSNAKTIHFRSGEFIPFSTIINYVTKRFIGYEISREEKNKIEVTQIAYIDKEEMSILTNRIFILLTDIVSSICSALKENNIDELKKIEDRHDTITKYVSYVLRSAAYGHFDDNRVQSCLSHIIATVDKIVDIFKYLARDVIGDEKVVGQTLFPLLDLVEDSFTTYTSLFRKFDQNKVVTISKNRDAFKQHLAEIEPRLPNNELKIAYFLSQSLELQYDLLEWRLHLHILG